MNELFPLFVFLSLGSVGFFSFISVAVWSDARRKEREAYYKADTLKKIAESQSTGATVALELFREQERAAGLRRREGIRLAGLVMTAAGLGLMIFLGAFVRDQRPVYLSGLIPVFIGSSLLLYSYVLAPKR